MLLCKDVTFQYLPKLALVTCPTITSHGYRIFQLESVVIVQGSEQVVAELRRLKEALRVANPSLCRACTQMVMGLTLT